LQVGTGAVRTRDGGELRLGSSCFLHIVEAILICQIADGPLAGGPRAVRDWLVQVEEMYALSQTFILRPG